MGSKKALYAWLLALVIIIAAVAAVYLPKYYHDYEPWMTKDAVPWGLLVPSYVYFALASTGSSIVNSLYTVFGYKGRKRGFEKVIKHGVWFSLITIIPAWIMIILDLGRADHFAAMLTSFNPVSRIAWMGVLYSFFFLMLLIEIIYFIRAEVNPKLKEWKAAELTIAILVLFATIAVHSNLGEVFGASTGVPGWYGPHVGAYFIASAVLIGGAWQAFYITTVYMLRGGSSSEPSFQAESTGLTDDLKEFITKTYNLIFLVGIPTLGFFELWNVIVAYYYPPAWAAFKQLLYGEFKYDYWIIEIGFGIIVSYILAIYGYVKRSLAATYVNAIILILAGYVSKFDFIISGEIGRLAFAYGGLTNNLNPYHVRFWPYHYEIGTPEKMMVVLAISIWLFLLTLGEWLLPLERGEKPKHWWVFR